MLVLVQHSAQDCVANMDKASFNSTVYYLLNTFPTKRVQYIIKASTSETVELSEVHSFSPLEIACNIYDTHGKWKFKLVCI